jgi:hypothetical protein
MGVSGYQRERTNATQVGLGLGVEFFLSHPLFCSWKGLEFCKLFLVFYKKYGKLFPYYKETS